MHEAISKSCDIYFYHMVCRLGADVIAAMAHQLGFGQKFDLPFPPSASAPSPTAMDGAEISPQMET